MVNFFFEERDAPNQILFGSRDPLYCAQWGLGIYMDAWHSESREDSKYLYHMRTNTASTKDAVYKYMKAEWESDNVTQLKPGLFGTHSNRKRSYTKMRMSGVSRDWADSRGRWKVGRVTNRYEDTLLPYPDAVAASSLCQGGPIRYVVRKNTPLTDAWLYDNVAVNMLKCQRLER